MRASRQSGRFRISTALGLVLVTGGVLVPVVADASFPGANGVIGFVSTRNNQVTTYQVNPAGSGVGTSAGDLANTTALTDGGGPSGGIDAEPFYSPDGSTVFFSSNRTGDWAVYAIPQSGQEPSPAATELSQAPTGTQDDYAPSVAPDGTTVVFNRGNASLYTLDRTVGAASVCLLYAPPGGLSAAGSDGSDSRAVFDPEDATKLLYVAGNGHIHLLSGLPAPLSSNRCGISAGSLTDTDLSASGSPAIGTAADANPDWSPDGTKIIFDSTRGGGHTLWLFTSPLSTPAAAALWPSLAAPNKVSDTQPVFSPDGTEIAYTQPQPGTQVVDFELNKIGNANGAATDLTLGAGQSQNSQSDWQPTVGAATPEAPMAVLLPMAGFGVAGVAAWRFRRGRGRPTVPAG
jgi:Tol biopolymer transport system component